MKISLEWINSYLDRPADAAEVEDLLTEQGFPIESQESIHHEDPENGHAVEDFMIDAEVTSNRSDCLSHLGMAREVAAGSERSLRPPDCSLSNLESDPKVQDLTRVSNESPELCPVYTARLIRDVKIAPSPPWLARRLEAIGLRPVNNVVDVTNFVLHELGQPLHAFDLARLAENRIIIRRARKGEQFTAIDESKHELSDRMLVIADARKAVAVAGIMGGLDSEVGSSTTDLLLESAMFVPVNIRSTSRAMKLASDSSYRFERGVDPEGVDAASRRAARLIVELAGGRLATGVIREGIDPPPLQTAQVRTGRCRALLGIEIPDDRMVQLLERLGFKPTLEQDGGELVIRCTVPSHRLDISREVDLIEEVGRLNGLQEIPVQEKIHIVARSLQPDIAARQALGRVLTGHGYHETVTFSFVSRKFGLPFVPPNHEALEIDDARRRSEPVLRPSILPNLLACRKSNQDVGNTQISLFETASVWSVLDGRIIERNSLALLHDATNAEEDIRAQKGTIEEFCHALLGAGAGAGTGDGIPDSNTIDFVPDEVPNLTGGARIKWGERELGCLGLLSDKTQALFDLQSRVVVAELDVEPLLKIYPPDRTVHRLSRFPGIERDLSIVVKDQVRWLEVQNHVRATDPPLLEELRFVGAYRGRPVPAGQKSLTFRMVFRDPQDTLRHDQVDPQVAAVVDRLKTELGATLRT